MYSLPSLSTSSATLYGSVIQHPDEKVARTIPVLQSQLFPLKVLAIAMASRWHRFADEARTASHSAKLKAPSGLSLPDLPTASSVGASSNMKNSRQTSSDHLSTSPGLTEPPPLDDNCAKYILSTMVLFLRQTAPPEGRLMSSANLGFGATFHDFESIEVEDAPSQPPEFFDADLPSGEAVRKHTRFPKHSTSSNSVDSGSPSATSSMPIPQLNVKFEKTHKVLAKSHFSLNSLILKFAGRIIYHLSASNWTVVMQRIRNKIHSLAGSHEENPDIIDLNLMKHSGLDRQRLVQILQGMSSNQSLSRTPRKPILHFRIVVSPCEHET